MKQERQAVTHGAGLQLKENQTRPYCTKHGLHHGQKYQSCRGFAKESTPSKPDFHAKPFWLHEPECPDDWKIEEGSNCEMYKCHRAYSEKDVLAEREHYEEQIAFWKRQQQLSADYGTAQNDALNKEIKSAEAAEKEIGILRTTLEKSKKNNTQEHSWRMASYRRMKKAEARVKELERDLAEFVDALPPQGKEMYLKLKAGEKTK